ncbi:MAG: amino acid permease [Acidobacteriaceae bacterium]|nr:amino acid permease [Acidobacteriaceae bacterium]
MSGAEPTTPPSTLVRGIGLSEATALNMMDMIGVGPFITIPLIVAAAGGPQAMLGWIAGALLAICDGMVWAELGAAMPGSGGSYRYLSECYGPQRLGRLMSFLFIWQLSFSAPLSIASGCIGLSQYAAYIFPGLQRTFTDSVFRINVPGAGSLALHLVVTGGTFVAMATCLLAAALLYRKITVVGRLSKLLWVGVVLTIAWVIIAGITNFSAQRAFDFPPGAFRPNAAFFVGMGSALLVATYDYWGYYNVCFFGGEVKDPARNIPRALVYSIVAVAAIYIVMNISILGVLPWRELAGVAKTETRFYVISTMMQRLYGTWAGQLAALLIMWTAFASVFSLLLGYSRVPYAAARDGNYFRAFARVHPVHRFPNVSLVALAAVALFFCMLRLADVIAALVVIRIVIQFLVQTVGLLLLRSLRPQFPRPFRMWLYPVPALVAMCAFGFVLWSRRGNEMRYAAVILVVGLAIYFVRAWLHRIWPFEARAPVESASAG